MHTRSLTTAFLMAAQLLISFSSLSQEAGFYDQRLQASLYAPTQKKPQTLLNANWQLDSMRCETFDGLDWEADSRYYYRYDGLHRRIQDSCIQFEHIAQAWQPTTLSLYQYLNPTSDLVSQVLELDWNGQGWDKDTFRTRNVYVDGRVTEIFQETSAAPSVWIPNGRATLDYNSAGLVSLRQTYFWNEATNKWVVIGRSMPQYAGDLLQEEVFQFTDDEGQTWENFSRFSYTIQNGRVEEMAIQIWEDSLWGPFFREAYQYDDRGLVVHEDDFLFNNGWKPTQRCDLFYSEQTTALHDIPKREPVSLQMANPFTGGQVVAPELASACSYRVTVYDLDGCAVQDFVSQGNMWQLPAPAAPGVFLLIVRQDGNVVARRKFVAAR